MRSNRFYFRRTDFDSDRIYINFNIINLILLRKTVKAIFKNFKLRIITTNLDE